MLPLGLTCLLVAASSGPTKLATADVLVDGKKAFVLERSRRTDAGGHTHLTSTFRDLRGRVVLVMDARMRAGHAVEVTIDQRQSKERGHIRIEPGRVRFEVKTPSGREDAESDALGIIVVGPELTTWVASDGPWRRLNAGEDVEFVVAAWNRLETYSFRLSPVPSKDPDELVLEMEPTNVLYRAFAGDMRYVFDKKTRRHLRYRGITALKQKDEDGDLEDVVAEIVFRQP